MRYLVLLFAFLQSCCWSCKDDVDSSIQEEKNKEGVIIQTPYIWKKPLYYSYNVDSKNKGNSILSGYGSNTYLKNGYLVGSNPEPGKSYYQFRAIETGKLIWQLPNDVVNGIGYNQSIALSGLYGTHQWQHYVITNPYYPLCINLKKGKVQWRLESEKGQHEWERPNFCVDGKYFFEKEFERDKYALYEVDVSTGNYREALRLNSGDYSVGALAHFRDKKGDFLFVITSIDYAKKQSYLGLYNYTQKQWLYNGIPTDGGHIALNREKDKIFFLDMQGFSCHRLSTGDKIWSDNSYNKIENGGPWDGRFAMVGNKLILAMGSDFLMCLDMDANYKKVLWENHQYNVGNSVSQFHVLNDVVYFADGGSGRICAIDPHTGKFLWFLKSPDLKEYGSGAFFKTDIWVIPGKGGKKGKIIASTYRSGVCYEAIK